MRKRTKKIEAKEILKNVPEEKVFWSKNGAILRNMYDLAAHLGSITRDDYLHHAAYDKNDFSNWLRDVVKDSILAKELVHARNKESAEKKVRERIEQLKSMVKND